MNDDNSQKNENLSERAKDPGFWKDIWHQIRLVFHLIRDPEVPVYLKLLPLAAILYVLMPLDLAPDWVIGLGQLDDLTALLVGAKVFVEMAPPHVVARHMDNMAGYKVEEKQKDKLAEAIIIDAEHEMMGDRRRKQNNGRGNP